MRKLIAIVASFLTAISGAKLLEVTLFKVTVAPNNSSPVNILPVTQNNNNSTVSQANNDSKPEANKSAEPKVEPLDFPVGIIFVPNK
jgi:hypothetical protein